ncbi:cytochrome c biogenesis protein ResB [Acidithiobacillus sp. M4-SHS-6]|uniref:cytochrome c biogenesis protein ResB n=1 Tax=Acidithiobacillus sp. M4-SHS-6 TaxID=3383024 RepID=UPI0039BE4890
MQADVEGLAWRQPGWRLLAQFLGSMRLAVSLLVLLAIASVIGVILPDRDTSPGPSWWAQWKVRDWWANHTSCIHRHPFPSSSVKQL